MNLYGIDFSCRNIPVLDRAFAPLSKFSEAFLKTAKKPLCLAVERNDGLTAVYDTFIHGTPDRFEADCFYAAQTVKLLLWTKGGYKISVCGDEASARHVQDLYAPGGLRAFDAAFMARVYERPFETAALPYDRKPVEKDLSKPLGRHLDGCRIGFDAGGSDRKVSAVIDGVPVFSEEVFWSPKMSPDCAYHFCEIVSSLRTAAEKMPRVDAIGISSAGIYINNRAMVASLFRSVPEAEFEAHGKDIYIRAVREIGEDIPFEVANDGDVAALAGAMELGETKILAIAMGTSEAGGYTDAQGNITGWLNELAFVPVDLQPGAPADEWSGDVGCGVYYFSQDAVIRLAPRAGITLDETASPAEKLTAMQKLVSAGDEAALRIFETIGCYLGHAVALYARVYDIAHVLLMGRVVSGKGGDLVLDVARRVLADEYPAISQSLVLHLPSEAERRVVQSVAAASLPALKKR